MSRTEILQPGGTPADADPGERICPAQTMAESAGPTLNHRLRGSRRIAAAPAAARLSLAASPRAWPALECLGFRLDPRLAT